MCGSALIREVAHRAVPAASNGRLRAVQPAPGVTPGDSGSVRGEPRGTKAPPMAAEVQVDQDASGSEAGRGEGESPDSPGAAPVPRDMAGRWQPGYSGNPAGRPALLAGVRELARRHTELAIAALAVIAADPLAPPGARIVAARELLDRGHGRPSPVELVQDLALMSDDELERLAWALPSDEAGDVPGDEDLAALSDEALDALLDEP